MKPIIRAKTVIKISSNNLRLDLGVAKGKTLQQLIRVLIEMGGCNPDDLQPVIDKAMAERRKSFDKYGV